MCSFCDEYAICKEEIYLPSGDVLLMDMCFQCREASRADYVNFIVMNHHIIEDELENKHISEGQISEYSYNH